MSLHFSHFLFIVSFVPLVFEFSFPSVVFVVPVVVNPLWSNL
jgi:hypothetical protein